MRPPLTARARGARRVGAAALLLIASIVSFPTATAAAEPASAPDKAAAEADARKAVKHFARRRFLDAAEAYEAAFRRVPNPKWLFGAANARHKNGDLVQAANAYARYLRDAPEQARQRPLAKTALAALEGRLGQLEIRADGLTAVTVDGDAIDLSSAGRLFVTPGDHVVEARFETGSVKESQKVLAGQSVTVVLVPPPEAPPPDPLATAMAKVSQSQHGHEVRRPLPPIVVWIGAGATGVLATFTVISGLDVWSQKNEFDAQRSRANLEEGKDKQLRTNVLFAVTGAVAALTGVAAIWFVDWRRDRPSESGVKVGAGLGSVVLDGRF